MGVGVCTCTCTCICAYCMCAGCVQAVGRSGKAPESEWQEARQSSHTAGTDWVLTSRPTGKKAVIGINSAGALVEWALLADETLGVHWQHLLNQNGQCQVCMQRLMSSLKTCCVSIVRTYWFACKWWSLSAPSLMPVVQPSAKMVQAAKNTVPLVENQSASLQLANMSRLTTIAISNLKNAVDRVSG